jgi:hypothetical protein
VKRIKMLGLLNVALVALSSGAAVTVRGSYDEFANSPGDDKRAKRFDRRWGITYLESRLKCTFSGRDIQSRILQTLKAHLRTPVGFGLRIDQVLMSENGSNSRDRGSWPVARGQNVIAFTARGVRSGKTIREELVPQVAVADISSCA